LIYKFFLIIAFVLSFQITLSQDSIQPVSSFGKFENGVSVSTSREEFIFVSDIGSNKVYKYSQDGTVLGSFGGSGMGINELNQPYSVDASNGLDVLIADFQNNRIKRLDINLNYIAQFDFNAYNQTADSPDKIYNPRSIASLSTGEVFVICDATNYKAAKVSDFIELKIVFGSNSLGYDRLDNPGKIVKGSQLDVWILDKGTNEILNFNNFGSYVKKITPADTVISMAFYNDNLFILHKIGAAVYDLKKGQYTKLYTYSLKENSKDIVLTDIALLDKGTVLLLSPKTIYKYKIN
jgi:hypothetical protein